jgi:pyruvate,water dikinase
VSEVLGARYPVLRYLAEIDEGDYLVPIRILTSSGSNKQLVITFEELLRRTPLAKRMTHMLQILEKNYFSPVDTEFTLRVVNPDSLKPEVEIVLLQCRPQSHLKDHAVSLPANLPEQDIVFSTTCMAPEGRIDDIQYVVFVPPEGYFGLPTSADRAKLCRVISAMNAVLKDEGFICIGPGRWGTSTPDLGVPIGYGDIYHAGALVELTGVGIGPAPEPSFGTHFFQDLIESNIFPLAIDLDDPETIFKREFFYGLPNDLAKFLPDQADMGKCLRLIRVANCRAGHHLTLVMDDEAGKSIAYLEADA